MPLVQGDIFLGDTLLHAFLAQTLHEPRFDVTVAQRRSEAITMAIELT